MKDSKLTPEEKILWDEYMKKEVYFSEKVKGLLIDYSAEHIFEDQVYLWDEVYKLAKSIGLVITDFSFDEDTLEPGWRVPINWKQRIL